MIFSFNWVQADTVDTSSTVEPGCGDGICSSSETCNTCSTDCGSCGGGGGIILAPVSYTCQGNVIQHLGGEIRCTLESNQMVKVVFPSYSIKGTVVVKIEPKSKAEVIKTNPLPQNTQIIGDLVTDFKTISGGKELEKFEEKAQITFTYKDEQAKEAGIDEKTLKIYWWDKSTETWKPLKGKVNTLTNTITAYTIHFTLFAEMGEALKVPIEPTIIEKIKQKLTDIAKKITDLKTQISQLFLKKEIRIKGTEIFLEEISPKEALPEQILTPAEKIFKKEVISTPEKIPSKKTRPKPIDILKEYSQWLWQSITNFRQKIWPH